MDRNEERKSTSHGTVNNVATCMREVRTVSWDVGSCTTRSSSSHRTTGRRSNPAKRAHGRTARSSSDGAFLCRGRPWCPVPTDMMKRAHRKEFNSIFWPKTRSCSFVHNQNTTSQPRAMLCCNPTNRHERGGVSIAQGCPVLFLPLLLRHLSPTQSPHQSKA